MPLPSAQDYNEAIQAPNLCFYDPALKLGRIRTNAMGLPVAVSGGFASVYQLTGSTGETWAIRCFIREVQDQQRRYTEISRTLETLKLPYMVPFQYQPNGIRAAGATFPIVKMQWLRGEQLGDYVQKHLNDSARLSSLARKWVAMIETLGRHNIAHCDLQHGNVLVVNDELRLIDYDGMFVPGLRGMRSNEVGHPNYQHPMRSETDFGAYTDNFSAWVVYASLRILSIDPSLLNLVRSLGRDECLLFNREDFTSPAASPFFTSLRFNGHPTVTNLAERVEKLATMSPRDVPSLGPSAVQDNEAIVTPVTGPSDWWKEPVTAKAGAGAAAVNRENDATEELERVRFSCDPRTQCEVFLFVCGSFMAFFVLSGPMGTAGYLITQLAILIALQQRLRTFYNTCPQAIQREQLMRQLASKRDELGSQSGRRDTLATKVVELQARLAGLVEKFQGERATLTSKQGAEMKGAHTAAAVAQSEFEKRRRALDDEEQRSLSAAIAGRQQQVQLFEAELRAFDARRGEILRTALEQHQRSALDGFLRRHDVRTASIAGVGEGFKAKLYAHGITTAADVEMWKVRPIRGFGATRSQTMIGWRDALAQHYSSRIPGNLPAADLQRIEGEFAKKRKELIAKIGLARQAVQSAPSDAAREFSSRRNLFQQEQLNLTNAARQELESINARYASQFGQLQQNLEQAKRAIEREIATHQLAQRNLDADVRRLNQWFNDIAPRIRQFEKINFDEFVWSVFLSPINLQGLRK